MTFYQELQLSSTGSKELIKKTTDPKEKRRHILIYNVKVYLVVAFCFALVTLFSAVFWFWKQCCRSCCSLSIACIKTGGFRN